jgi:L-fuconolactonase
MIPRIDAHHHFWKFAAAEYGWIGADQRVLRRDFLPGDFEPELAAAGITGTIAVQARQSIEETRWLLELADLHDFIH